MPAPDRLDPVVARDLAELDAALAGASDDDGLRAFVDAVRDARPEPGPRFAPRLDHRVAAGFPPDRRRRRSWWAWAPAPAFAAALLVALVVAVATLSGGGDDLVAGGGGGSGASTAGRASGGDVAADAGGESAAAPEAVRDAGGVVPVPPSPSGGVGDEQAARKVERAAALTLAVPTADVPDVADRIVRVADSTGGFVQSSSVDTSEEGANGTFELRVPVARLPAAIAALSRLGHVRDRSQTEQDITAEAVGVRERLTDARAERRTLSRQLASAASPRETIALRARLRTVRREIARLRAAARRIDTRAAFATVSVQLVGDDDAGGAGAGGGRWTPGDALRDAARVLEVAAGVALVTLAVAVPLLLLAVPAAVAGRRVTRVRRERALDAL